MILNDLHIEKKSHSNSFFNTFPLMPYNISKLITLF